jgi:hypothetical protein
VPEASRSSTHIENSYASFAVPLSTNVAWACAQMRESLVTTTGSVPTTTFLLQSNLVFWTWTVSPKLGPPGPATPGAPAAPAAPCGPAGPVDPFGPARPARAFRAAGLRSLREMLPALRSRPVMDRSLI